MRMATFFSAGFGRYLDSGEFGDVVLEAAEGNERFVAHRLVLGYSSAHFARLLLQPSLTGSSSSGTSLAIPSSTSSPQSLRGQTRTGSPPSSPTAGVEDRQTTTTSTTSSSPAADCAGAVGRAADSGRDHQGARLKNSTSVKTTKQKKEKKTKHTLTRKKKKKDKDKEKEKEKEKDKDKKSTKKEAKKKSNTPSGEIHADVEQKEANAVKEENEPQPISSSSDSESAHAHGSHSTRPVSGLSKSADALNYNKGGIRRGIGIPVDGTTSSPTGDRRIPEPPPPPVRLARRVTGSGTVVLPRPYALRDASVPHHHNLAITRSLSGSTDRSSLRKGGSMLTGSSNTPRSSFSSSSSSAQSNSLSGDASEASTRNAQPADLPQDEIIYSSPGRGHERTSDDHLPVIQLDFPDPNCIFPSVLRFMYEGYIEIMPENAIPLLAMADHYCIEILKKLCSDYVIANIDRENALWMLERAILYNAEEIIKTCVNVIARNFSYIYNANYNVLPYELLINILEHPCLAVKAMGEWALFQIVRDYIAQHRQLTNEEKYRLYSTVRYRWMTTDELAQLQTANVVPSDLIIEALMERLKDAEREKYSDEPSKSLDQSDAPKNARLMPRPSFGILFDYAYDYDKKGVIFWIATNRGREPWSNPHSTGMLRVTASSIEKGDPVKLVSQKPSELWSGDVPASWFAIDLGPNRTLVPNYYTLRHGGNYKADSLRTWDLQGSTDGKHWIVLRRHTNDTSLSGPFATHSWPITPSTEAYRHFRILQTGHNSSNHNFLVLSGVEFYGELFET